MQNAYHGYACFNFLHHAARNCFWLGVTCGLPRDYEFITETAAGDGLFPRFVGSGEELPVAVQDRMNRRGIRPNVGELPHS